jgi:hypothetical protein
LEKLAQNTRSYDTSAGTSVQNGVGAFFITCLKDRHGLDLLQVQVPVQLWRAITCCLTQLIYGMSVWEKLVWEARMLGGMGMLCGSASQKGSTMQVVSQLQPIFNRVENNMFLGRNATCNISYRGETCFYRVLFAEVTVQKDLRFFQLGILRNGKVGSG